MQNIYKNYIYPVVTLTGSIIGVGFLSLPYITLQVGSWVMLFYFIVLIAIVLSVHIIFTKIRLKTPDFKRWPGFVEFYFGKPFKIIIMPLIILGIFGVMLVYMIVGGKFLTAIFSESIQVNELLYVLCYWVLANIFIFFGVKVISKFNFWALVLLVGLLVFIFIEGFSKVNISNIFIGHDQLNPKNLFLPYGAILFALWGTGLIPEVEEMLEGKKHLLKNIVIIATLIPAIIYIVFILLILSITGNQTTESALVGVKNVLGDGVISIVLFIGVITTFIAFISQGLLLKKILIYDAGVKVIPAFLIVFLVPIMLFLVGFNSFIQLISFIGGVLLGIEGILILIMYTKIGGKKIIAYPLMLVFSYFLVVCFLG